MMLYNPNYYNNLLNNYPENIPSPFEAQINLDLGRTYPNDSFFTEKENIKKLKNILIAVSRRETTINIQKLKNILIAISRRETTIGYCQGFNFIVGKILKICGNEVIIFLFILIFS